MDQSPKFLQEILLGGPLRVITALGPYTKAQNGMMIGL